MLGSARVDGKTQNSNELKWWKGVYLMESFLLHQYLPWYHWVFIGKRDQECVTLATFSFC